jgi:tRNA threonylcarbamoyl adenosine modification protein YeaZ
MPPSSGAAVIGPSGCERSAEFAMLVLAIDTSTPAITAGLVELRGDSPRQVAAHAPHDARGHAELLAPTIRVVLEQAGVGIADLDAVVAGLGPGPFTGLRVGLVTAAVLCDVRGLPVYGVCSLDGIGAALPDEHELLVATDARRREVYWARYRNGRRVAGPGVERPSDLPLDGVTAVAGPGAELYAEDWAELPRFPRDPDPVALVLPALDRITARAPSESLTPLYLRRPDATIPGAPKRVTP